MSSYKFVCFDCRNAYRRDPNSKNAVVCSSCGKDCACIGVKIPIPPKNKIRKWAELRAQLNAELVERVDNKVKETVATKHSLEKEIEKLSLLPSNSGRNSLIKRLKSRLATLNV